MVGVFSMEVYKYSVDIGNGITRSTYTHAMFITPFVPI